MLLTFEATAKAISNGKPLQIAGLIVSFGNAARKDFSQNAAGYRNMFMKNITGWTAGANFCLKGRTAEAEEIRSDRAVALNLQIPAHKTASMNIVKLSPEQGVPLIEFTEEGFSVVNRLADGGKTVIADYSAQNAIGAKLPFTGEYSENEVNITFKSLEKGVVNFYTPALSGVRYLMAKEMTDYADKFNTNIAKLKNTKAAFSRNCILNFLYDELEDKKTSAFTSSVTPAEKTEQTLVYVTVEN